MRHLAALRTGAPWRDLPPELGNWHTTYTRFARWKKTGVWGRILGAVSDGVDLEEVFIDSTAIRAHLHAAGAQKKHGAQALGRSRGGWGTKIHMIADALGNPLAFTPSPARKPPTSRRHPRCSKRSPRLQRSLPTRATTPTPSSRPSNGSRPSPSSRCAFRRLRHPGCWLA